MLNYRDFVFPLNVYAHVLCLDYGGFEYLHYGMFEPGEDNVRRAQEQASRMLFARLPTTPMRILEVGIGVGTTLSRLVAAGHQATGITPDANQVGYARQTHGPSLPTVCTKLEDYTEGGFDWLVFQESAQYIDTATLFRKASELLVEGGQVLIMDEMTLRSSGEPGLPSRDDYLTQARMNGFMVVENLDLSALAGPTNTHIFNAVTQHRGRLVNELSLPPQQIDLLLDSARLYDEKYRDGRYGYGLIHVQKQPLN
jgi:2-polyprenyl-3-methyl-5-hydroxy-6-metoxy-1,4-benzoquinol methylase